MNRVSEVAESVHPWCTPEVLGSLDLADLRVLLVQPSYRPSAAHTVVDDETDACPRAHELTVDGYARQALAGCRVIKDASELYLEAPPEVGFGELEAGERVGGAVLFLEAGSDRLSSLLGFWSLRTLAGRIPGTNNLLFIVSWGPYSDPPKPVRLLRAIYSPPGGDRHE